MSDRKGIIIQMTGMSGSGKTTLSLHVKELLESKGYKVAVIDGDTYRQTLCQDLGFSKADRLENVKRLGRFAYAMAADFDVLFIAAINPYEEGRLLLKEQYNAQLLFLDCPMETLIHRDTKGLYRRALLDEKDVEYLPNFTGITDPFERPIDAAIVLNTDEQSIEASGAALLDYLLPILTLTEEDSHFQEFLVKLKEQAYLPAMRKDNALDYLRRCKLFRGMFELNMQELYQFIFHEYKDGTHFESWLKSRLGDDKFIETKRQFLSVGSSEVTEEQPYEYQVLTADQLQAWQDKGYLVVSGIVDTEDCDLVTAEICSQLGVKIDDPNTWCPSDPNWQGILLFSRKSAAEEKIMYNSTVRAVFEDLYRDKRLLAMRAPLGYMPPLSSGYPFRGSSLHWDIDLEVGPRYHVQALLYLQDVEEKGGAFSVIPGVHTHFNELMEQYGGMHEAAEVLQQQQQDIKIAGKKGDLILWLETLPHAATPNYSDVPRFVQYLTYEQLRLT